MIDSLRQRLRDEGWGDSVEPSAPCSGRRFDRWPIKRIGLNRCSERLADLGDTLRGEALFEGAVDQR
jgi:hypothetical protein